jgi:hypothetical protein
MLRDLFSDFGRDPPSEEFLQACADWRGVGRDLYEGLGMKYTCVDTDGRYGALQLDINFDAAPEEHRNRYGFVTNHGTTEHLINQLNAFNMVHDFTKPGGYMLHALPFLGQLDHGFFNYQPNLFESLAMYNSYRNCGMWVGIAYDLSSFVPYQKHLLQHLNIKPDSTGLLVVLLQKMYAARFCVPFQGVYENTKTEHVSSRYAFVVDGELYEGSRDRYLTRDRPIPEQMQRTPGALLATGPPPAAYLPHIRSVEMLRELRRRAMQRAFGLLGAKR